MKIKSVLSFIIVFAALFLLIGAVFLAVFSHDQGAGGPKAEFIANYFGAFAAPSFLVLVALAKLGWTNYTVFTVSVALNALVYTSIIALLSRIWNRRKMSQS